MRLIRWVCCSVKSITFAVPISDARVAELVDALVSNTSEVTLVPVRPRPRVQKNCSWNHEQFLYTPFRSLHVMNHRTKLWMPVVFAALIISGMFIGAKLTPVNRMFSGSMSASIYNYSKLQDILFLIERDYVDKVDQNELVDMAIQGMLKQLDPHSVYITSDQMAAVQEEITGRFEGIGVQFSIRRDTVQVMNVVRGGPAELAGVMAGDRIITVDGKDVAGKGISNEEVMQLLKGPRGSEVQVEVLRPATKKKLIFPIIRNVISTSSVDAAYMLNSRTGYLKINTFTEKTYSEFMESMGMLESSGMKKLVLDLRGNGGGLLDQAISITNEFLGRKELIVYTMGKSGRKKTHYANGNGRYQKMEITVLIDDFSASASEILAGAIQDHDRGTLIGRRTFGKGLVQQQVMLTDGSALRITTERYYTPAGRSIQKPYNGTQEEYYGELMERYYNGGMQSADSAPHPDSLIFRTLKKNRIVYGGGGITPDIFIPFHNPDDTELFKELSRSGIFFEFAYDYADRQREALLTEFDTLKFVRNFIPDQALLNEFWKMAVKQGFDARKRNARSDDRILHLLKAFIARNIYGEEPYLMILNQQDEAVRRAVKN
jgi:carboxyl-terminal processing protease